MSERENSKMTQTPINEHIQIVAEAFARELRALHTKSDWPDWQESRLQLVVSGSKEGAKFKLRWINPTGTDVEASSLDRLIEEVNHRLGFEDIEQARIQSSLTALPAPEPVSLAEELDDRIPF